MNNLPLPFEKVLWPLIIISANQYFSYFLKTPLLGFMSSSDIPSNPVCLHLCTLVQYLIQLLSSLYSTCLSCLISSDSSHKISTGTVHTHANTRRYINIIMYIVYSPLHDCSSDCNFCSAAVLEILRNELPPLRVIVYVDDANWSTKKCFRCF